MKWPTLSADTRWLLWRISTVLILAAFVWALVEPVSQAVLFTMAMVVWLFLERQPIHITVVVPAPDEWDDDGGTQLPLPKLPQRFTFHQNETRH